jgi:hypothetical protein
VPLELQNQPPESGPLPDEQPERVRYTVAYEAAWWNCVMLKADDLGARCPLMRSGTPGAALGCADGANAADQGVATLLEEHPPTEVKKYLKSLAAERVAKEKMEQAERVRE